MKQTKYLFPDGKDTEEMVSISQLQSFMSCPKKWEYGYVENLTPRVERPYLGIGKLCHKGMEAAMRHKWMLDTEYPDSNCYKVNDEVLKLGIHAMEREWTEYIYNTPFLEEELPEQEQILEDAKKVFAQAWYEFHPEKYEVYTIVDKGISMPALELHFLVPCAGSKGLHGYIDAILRDTETGHIWSTDYKFRKTLSPDEEEATNIQNAVYSWACHKMGISITGTMTWQHCNTPAADPALLKNGTVSRAKIKTTWEHYMNFCLNHKIDPTSYEGEMCEKLADIEWFRATYEYRNDETIKNMWNQVVVPAAYAVKAAHKGNNRRHLYPWNCKMCQFKDLCQAELRGHDANFLRQSEYTKRK